MKRREASCAAPAWWQEYTNYHFDVRPEALHGALDRFAQFFVAPLCKADALEREVQAVDNEFTGSCNSHDAPCRMQDREVACCQRCFASCPPGCVCLAEPYYCTGELPVGCELASSALSSSAAVLSHHGLIL